MKLNVDELFEKIKNKRINYDEDEHCKLVLRVMADPERGTYSACCIDIGIGEATFYRWVHQHPLFGECFAIGKMWSRERWEEEGRRLREEIIMPGTINYKYDYWKMVGWSRFGIGKNSRIRLDLNPNDSPIKHYSQIIEQAGKGDFTAGEIKQLMEAVKIGLSTEQAVRMQEEIDQLKKDLATMVENSNAQHQISD